MKKIFLTFASSDLYRSLSRIKQQAYNMEIYDEINIMTEINLNDDFKNQFQKHLKIGSRGYGYWCWKPQIILQTLEKMGDGDILQYTDSGCHLNVNGRKRLLQYFEMAKASKTGILGFQAINPTDPLRYDGRKLFDLPDFKWTKGDLLDYFNVRNITSITNTPTVTATAIFIKKCPASLHIINKWLETIKHNFSLIDDTPSISENLDGFREHRHDQAIFSLLCKINNVDTISSYEYWYPQKRKYYKANWRKLRNFPIHAKRDRDFGPIGNSKALLIKLNKKIKRIIWHLKHGF